MKTLKSSLTQIARTSKKTRRYLASTALTATGLLALASPAMADNWGDLSGTGFDTDVSIPDTTNINQHVDIVHATGDLDINEGHTVNIYQPGWDSIFAATDVEGDPTFIRGRINANGQVIITDNNGVFFTNTSVVNVGSIVASTGNLASTDDELRDGKAIFKDVDKGGVIDLQGQITVAEAGLAAFVAPVVKNSGLIQAKMGTIVFAAAPKVTLDLYGDNLVEIAVDDKLGDALIENTGTIKAEGGTVVMTAQAAKSAVDDVINMKGVVDVSSVTVKGGKIILNGGTQGTVKVSGKLDASGKTGGDIDIDGDIVNLTSASVLDVSSKNSGDGAGSIIAWGNRLYSYGVLAALGKNGFIETSMTGDGEINNTVKLGENGEYLIDPTNVCISASNNCGGGSWTWINTASLVSALNSWAAGATYTVQTQDSSGSGGDLVVNSAVNTTTTNANVTLRLRAHDDIAINGAITNTGAHGLNVALDAGYDESNSVGDDNDITINAAITTNGGSVTLDADSDIFVNNIVNAGAGSITATADDDIIVGGNGGNGDDGDQGNIGENGADGSTGTAGTPEYWQKKTYPYNIVYGNPHSSNFTYHAGVPGTPGSNGADGDNGTPGDNGDNGSAGNNGGFTTTTGNIYLTAGDEIVLGGNGGDGGNGGKGGKGGNGGDGKGDFDGGDGGNGGKGGKGGNGGQGGNGSLTSGTGNIYLTADDIDFKGANGDTGNGGQNGSQGSNGDDAPGSQNDGEGGNRGSGGQGGTGGSAGQGGTGSVTTGSTVFIDRYSNGDISLGDNNGGLHLSQSEIAAIDANDLTIGGDRTSKITVDDVDTTTSTIDDLVTLITQVDTGSGDDVVFKGTNVFNALEVNSDDDIIFDTNAKVETKTGDAKFTGDDNDQNVGNFEMKSGSKLDTNGHNVDISVLNFEMGNNAQITTEGGNVTIETRKDLFPAGNGNVTILGGLINADGGDILIDNDGVFYSQYADSLITHTDGTITLNQNAGGSIQNAVNALNNTGSGLNTLYVGAGTYTENLTLNQANLKLDGAPGAIVQAATAGNLVTVIVNNVNIDPFVFDGLGIANYGINANGVNNLIVDGNTFQNFLLTNINVSNGSGIRIFGNTMTGAQKGVYADNTADIWIYDNDINGATVAGVHLVNTDGTNYTDDADIWYNRINSAAGSIGILVEGSDYATVGAHLTNQPNLDDSLNGNVITGGLAGIVVNNSGNAMVRYNDVSNTSSDGIHVSGGSNNKVWDNKIANIGWDGIGFIGSTNGDIKRNTISNVTGASGIAVMNGSHDTVVADNVITGVDRMGIYVWNSNGLDILSNNVFDTGREGGNIWYLSGIHLENANNTLVQDNVVGKTAGDGIHVGGPGNNPAAQQTTGNQIIGNRVGYKETVPGSGIFASAGVDNIKGDGVFVMRSDGALVKSNVITETHSSGPEKGSSIQIKDSDNVTITRNTMSNSGWDYIRLDYEGGTLDNLTVTKNTGSGGAERVGIYAERLTNSLIEDNNLSDTTRYGGIYAEGGHDLTILSNRIDDSDEIGIFLNNTTGSNLVAYNWITDTGLDKKAVDGSNNGDGIRIVNSGGTLASHTTIFANQVGTFDTAGNINGNGISVIDSAYTDVLLNNVMNTVGNGIFVDPSPYTIVAGNWVNNTGDDGIHILDSDFVQVLGNFVGTLGGNFNIVGDGIFVENSDNVEVSWNRITNTKSPANDKGSGIQTYRSDDVVISNNTIWDTNWDGIRLDESDRANVSRNEIDDVTRTGIYAEFGDNLTVNRNDIDDVGHDGIFVYTVNTSDVTNNRIDDAGRYGLHITNGRDAYAADNDITDIALDGIFVNGVRTKAGDTYAVILDDNYVARTGDNGIYVANLRNVAGVTGEGRTLISRNVVWNTGLDGIHVYNSEAGVVANVVNDTGNKAMGEGIHLDHADNSNVLLNLVGLLGGNNNINGDGIYLTNSDNGTVMFNLITNTKSPMINHGSGVQLVNSDNGLVARNTIWDTGWDGIRLDTSSNVVARNNNIDDVTRTGIYAETADNITVSDNDIDDAGHDGVYIWTVKNSLVENNRIGLNGGANNIHQYGVHVTNGSNTQVLNNDISDAGIDGIIISGTKKSGLATYAAIISGNEIDRSGEDGIEMRNVGDSLITDNNVDTSGAVGILISRFNNGRMTVAGNTVNLFDVGMQFESGVIDLTGASNTISNGNTGMLFKPYDLGGGSYAPLSLVEDDAVGTSTPFVPGVPPTDYAGTLGAQIFQNIAGQYVELDNYAFWDFVNGVPFWIDARFGDYDGIRPADFPGFVMDPVTYGILEDKLLHYPDGIRDVGIFFFGSIPAVDTFDANESQFFRDFDDFSGDITGLNIRILGLPNTGFGGGAGGGTTASALNNIGPFAGNSTNPGDLNAIETAAGGDATTTTQQNPADIEPAAGGGENASCWGDAMNVAQTGQAVNVVYTGSLDDTVSSAANCANGSIY